MKVERLLIKEGEMMVKKHENLISAVNKALKENANYGKELDALGQTKLATMLENVSNAFDTRASLKESGVQVGDIANKNEYLKLIAAVMPVLVLEDIASVQPLKQKAGIAFYVKHKYASNRGKIADGDNISSFRQVGPDADKIPGAFNYSSQTIEGEVVTQSSNSFKLAWGPVVPGSVKFVIGSDACTDKDGEILKAGTKIGTIDYTTGVVTFSGAQTIVNNEVSYEQDLYTSPTSVPRVKTSIEELPLYARPRKLATEFSLDSAFDLMATQNVDLQALVQSTATDEIRAEIDGEGLNDMKTSGTGMSVSFNQPVPFGISKYEHYESFLQTIVEASNKIYNKTRRVAGNIVIVGENAANIIETHSKFKAAGTMNEAGPHIMGTLNGKYIIVKNPYYGSDEFVVTYKGSNPFDAGYIYAPYMPITSTQFIMGANFNGEQGYATSYAKKLVDNGFFVNGLITHADGTN